MQILYWMTGFANDVGRFFFFILVVCAHELATSSLFRLYAFALPKEELAQAAAGITTGSFLLFGGCVRAPRAARGAKPS